MFNKNSKKNENLDLELEENSLSLCVCVLGTMFQVERYFTRNYIKMINQATSQC